MMGDPPALTTAVEGEPGVGPAGEESPPLMAGPSTEMAVAVERVARSIEQLQARQDELRELFESRIRCDEVQVKALEHLHDQLREYKANFVRQEMQPLLRDLIYCYDTAAQEVERARASTAPIAAEDATAALDHVRQMIADVLAKYDMESYRVPGPAFDRREQQCVGVIDTDDVSADKQVATLGAVGFRTRDVIIRKEQVTVFKYRAATP
ncbi:MAG: nucleotide exchange factor GrpE [Planctomycetaceae bacterium]|nr:nucleotide exchange factor GrpE [Planctomycetaceae bacterium]